MRKLISFVLSFIYVMNISWSMFQEATTDISYVLPGGGRFESETGEWLLEWDEEFGSSTAFFATSGDESYVVLRCYEDDLFTRHDARIQISNIQRNMDLSNVKKQQMQISITFRGSPDPQYGNGTIFGIIQPQLNSAYWGEFGLRQPGVSPAFQEAASYKATSFDTTENPSAPDYTFATLAVTTVWNTMTWRFIPIHPNFYQLGYLGVKYQADMYTLDGIGPPFTTEVHIKEIKLEAIRFY